MPDTATRRDELAIASNLADIGLALKWISQDLGDAYVDAADLVGARRAAMRAIAQVRGILADIEAELRALGRGG